MKKLVLFVSILCSAALASADVFNPAMPSFKGFVKVRPDRELYVEYTAARPGYPTVVLLNGLTYSTSQWDAYVGRLQSRGVGIVRYDMDGMGRTLLKYAPSMSAISYEQQAVDLKALLTEMRIRPPYNIAGLSYGGGIAVHYAVTYPRDIGKLILMAPFTQPLDGQDAWIRGQIWATRRAFPANPASDDELYDFFLRQIVYSTYPTVEPVVLENPYKLEGVFNLVRGIRKFRAIDVAGKLPPGTVHLMVAASDQYIPGKVLEDFWARVSPRARMSRIRVFETEHKMPEAVPAFTAAWTWQILKGNPLLSAGRDFEGFGRTMSAKTRDGRPVPLED